MSELTEKGFMFDWYLVRRGHLRKKGSSTAGEYVFHLSWLWLYRLCDMDLISLRERREEMQHATRKHVWFLSIFISFLQQ